MRAGRGGAAVRGGGFVAGTQRTFGGHLTSEMADGGGQVNGDAGLSAAAAEFVPGQAIAPKRYVAVPRGASGSTRERIKERETNYGPADNRPGRKHLNIRWLQNQRLRICPLVFTRTSAMANMSVSFAPAKSYGPRRFGPVTCAGLSSIFPASRNGIRARSRSRTPRNKSSPTSPGHGDALAATQS